ncbi:conjugal transfer protein TraD [Chryseobacterium elymi]|uniref:Conjugal transfer protein TraD n=1 Tax=Chryseobacterium elymi TaxID=395936 RepID=A0A3D9DNA2_9FLAO|nr:conjugal transfer protein TraD [Chryseobacterium elymi]REC79487.1 conjugal transfer protein TraD [Chryseobacterium elymi]
MEVLILTCLLTIIILLLKDKLVINKITRNPVVAPKKDPKDIMGKSRYVNGHSAPTASTESQINDGNDKEDNFEMNTEGKGLEHPVPEKNSEEYSEEDIDYEEEEEEFKTVVDPNEVRGYAKGVSFQELNDAGQVLRNNDPDPVSIKKAVAVVRKIEGTDLFYLLENAMEGSSRKIADLLNKNLPDEVEPKTSENGDDFDIGDFI